MNNASPVPMSSEMRNVMKSMCNYLDAHSNGEMNNKIDDIEQFVDNLMLKKQCEEKYQIIFQKLCEGFIPLSCPPRDMGRREETLAT
ncbi:hypothetical protein TNCV_4681031 [Trichonephila clavipes]|nr:hypothetical protein TNCV_4681031 [Trichonephila clavipes]